MTDCTLTDCLACKKPVDAMGFCQCPGKGMDSPVIDSTVVSRNSCRACGGLLETIHDFGEVPIINFGDREEIKAPLCLTKCASCHLVQLRHTIDKDKLFKTYYYRSATSTTMREHLRGIAEEAKKRANLLPDDVVVDIGANDGTLLDNFSPGLIHMGYEPSDAYKGMTWRTSGAVNDYFEAASYSAETGKFTKPGKKAKLILALGMFYDLDDPNAFLQDIKKVLAPDGLFVIEQAYLPEMLRTNNIGNIVHEHLTYYSLMTLERLLSNHELGIEDVEFSDINGGVFRVYVRHFGDWMKEEKDRSLNKLMLEEMHSRLDKIKTYTDFIKRVFQQAAKLHDFIESSLFEGMKPEELTKPYFKTIDIYGPSTRGLMLLQIAGLESKHFRFAVDRNPDKVGKTYFGVPVVSEETMRNNPPDYLLILPQSFLGEFVVREMGVLEKGTKFILPLPEPRVLGVERI